MPEVSPQSQTVGSSLYSLPYEPLLDSPAFENSYYLYRVMVQVHGAAAFGATQNFMVMIRRNSSGLSQATPSSVHRDTARNRTSKIPCPWGANFLERENRQYEGNKQAIISKKAKKWEAVQVQEMVRGAEVGTSVDFTQGYTPHATKTQLTRGVMEDSPEVSGSMAQHKVQHQILSQGPDTGHLPYTGTKRWGDSISKIATDLAFIKLTIQREQGH